MARDRVTYEWVAEETDEHGDVNNCQFFETRAEAEAAPSITGCPIVVALVRNTGNNADGLTSRYYAYLNEDGSLPEFFSTIHHEADGPSVPQRFHAPA